MDSHINGSLADEGLGLSVLIYVAALIGGLAVIGLPIYYANAPTVLQNPDASTVGSMLAARRQGVNIPLANIKHPDIVTAADLAALNVKVKPAQHHERAVAHAAPREHEQNSYADASYERRPRGSFFPFFSLF